MRSFVARCHTGFASACHAPRQCSVAGRHATPGARQAEIGMECLFLLILTAGQYGSRERPPRSDAPPSAGLPEDTAAQCRCRHSLQLADGGAVPHARSAPPAARCERAVAPGHEAIAQQTAAPHAGATIARVIPPTPRGCMPPRTGTRWCASSRCRLPAARAVSERPRPARGHRCGSCSRRGAAGRAYYARADAGARIARGSRSSSCNLRTYACRFGRWFLHRCAVARSPATSSATGPRR